MSTIINYVFIIKTIFLHKYKYIKKTTLQYEKNETKVNIKIQYNGFLHKIFHLTTF